MASTSASNPIDSSIADRRWSYHVFLSFRGADTRENFISHLLRSLKQLGINYFFDEEGLDRGEQIAPALLKAIEGSRIAVVVFSENYASSTWCLEELSKTVECSESRGQTLIPIFYKVEPLVVRRQPPGSVFHADLEKYEERFKDNPNKVKNWRVALRKASDRSGEHFNKGNEADFVEKIAQLVSKTLGWRWPLLEVAKNPVGLDSEIEKVKIGSPEECFVGIVGIGGIGKTTLAKAMYNRFAEDYEGCSFLSDVREKTTVQNNGLVKLQKRDDGLVKLQKQLLSDLLGGKNEDLSSVSSGINLIKDRLQNKRCLIVLDDVDHFSQIEALAGGCDWFGPGSRIIVTTRNEHLLIQVGASIHRMKGLSDENAHELLSRSAFKKTSPPDEFATVCSAIVNYAKGLPLALTVLGSFLVGRGVSQWESEIKRLKDGNPEEKICEILKISYDGLSEDEKAIFLHIVCFFKDESKDRVVEILRGCGYHPEIGIPVLVERSLVTIEHRLMRMHDLIEQMGILIARGEKSMLWTIEEIRSVLEEDNTEPMRIQAMYLKNYDRVSIRLNNEAFKKMRKLRMLILPRCDFSCGPSYLPNELRWLEWGHYPSPLLPRNFNPENLSALKLSRSRLRKLWDGQQKRPNLTVINLAGSKSLLEIPDVSEMPELKQLMAQLCDSLVSVHESVGNLEKLEYLSFDECISLKNLPTELKLPSLQYLGLWGCKKLEKFPDILGRMDHLETLDLSETSIKELPQSIENLTGLQTLRLKKTYIKALPGCIYHLQNLRELDLAGCKSLCGFMEKGKEKNVRSRSPLRSSSCFPNLENLDLSHSNIISLSPCISNCHNLKDLDLSWSKQLREIPELPRRLMYMYARGCKSLEKVGTKSLRWTGKIIMDFSDCRKLKKVLGSEMLWEWLKGHEERIMRTEEDSSYHFEALFPGGDIPDQFYLGCIGDGKKRLRFRVHSRFTVLEGLSGFVLSAAFSRRRSEDDFRWSLKINEKQVLAQKGLAFVGSDDHVWIVYLPLMKRWKEEMLLLDGWNHFSFEVEPDNDHFFYEAEPRHLVNSFGVSFIGRSGEDFNSSNGIEFLSAEEITDHEDTEEEAMTDYEDAYEEAMTDYEDAYEEAMTDYVDAEEAMNNTIRVRNFMKEMWMIVQKFLQSFREDQAV